MSAKRSTPQNKINAPATTGAIKADKIAQSGLKTRVRGHVKAANQRNQAKRDGK
jgi:hypothetical protein